MSSIRRTVGAVLSAAALVLFTNASGQSEDRAKTKKDTVVSEKNDLSIKREDKDEKRSESTKINTSKENAPDRSNKSEVTKKKTESNVEYRIQDPCHKQPTLPQCTSTGIK